MGGGANLQASRFVSPQGHVMSVCGCVCVRACVCVCVRVCVCACVCVCVRACKSLSLCLLYTLCAFCFPNLQLNPLNLDMIHFHYYLSLSHSLSLSLSLSLSHTHYVNLPLSFLIPSLSLSLYLSLSHTHYVNLPLYCSLSCPLSLSPPTSVSLIYFAFF